LAAVSGYVELLADAELDADERADLLERSTRQLERIRSIIRNLLDYSRADRSVERIPCELRTVAEDAVALVEAIPRARGKRFSVRGEAMAYTFPAHVVQVLVNLLVNAVDAYGDKPGEVRVELEQTKSSARVAVHEDASGMDEDELSRIFEPFYTTKDPGEGTGLGLSICQRIVEDLDGTLNVKSDPGEGTVFTLEFPVPPSEEP
jgi:signal transduction histidine kinase